MEEYEFPEAMSQWLEKQLSARGFSLERPRELAPLIKRLSDQYLDPSVSLTPWTSLEDQAGYLAYFFVLNFVRLRKVIAAGESMGFFAGLETSIDFGCGPGTWTRALHHHGVPITRFFGMDKALTTKTLFEDGAEYRFTDRLPQTGEPKLVALSYALNELPRVPPWVLQQEALVIVEPSSHQQSQNLQEFRQDLIDCGYFIWGPCLHQGACPLLAHKKDWCHDRTYWRQPPWFTELAEALPMNNHSLAFSYILARKSKPPATSGFRVIGDARVEKGKTRWQVCPDEKRRSQTPENRLFLSCLKRSGKAPTIYRGDRVDLKLGDTAAQETALKGNELRFSPEDLLRHS